MGKPTHHDTCTRVHTHVGHGVVPYLIHPDPGPVQAVQTVTTLTKAPSSVLESDTFNCLERTIHHQAFSLSRPISREINPTSV